MAVTEEMIVAGVRAAWGNTEAPAFVREQVVRVYEAMALVVEEERWSEYRHLARVMDDHGFNSGENAGGSMHDLISEFDDQLGKKQPKPT